jgi:ribonuclease HI
VAAYGYLITSDEGIELACGCGVVGEGEGMTNNVGEYFALLKGLERALLIAPEGARPQFLVRGDSQLVINQMSGKWQIKSEMLGAIAIEIRELVEGAEIKYEWVPRERNAAADSMANEAYQKFLKGKMVPDRIRKEGGEK